MGVRPREFYDHAGHQTLADRGRRRYHPYSFDFDSTPMNLRATSFGQNR